jgi:hypothetical protein
VYGHVHLIRALPARTNFIHLSNEQWHGKRYALLQFNVPFEHFDRTGPSNIHKKLTNQLHGEPDEKMQWPSSLVDATADGVEPGVNTLEVDGLGNVPADGGVIKIAESVVGRVMETSRGRALRVDPVAAMGVPGPGVGVVAEQQHQLDNP